MWINDICKKKILEIKEALEEMEIETFVSNDVLEYNKKKTVDKDEFNSSDQKTMKDLIRLYYKEIEKADAILVVDEEKNNIKNYIGANTFLEIGFAHVLEKRIFLLNPIPEITYSDEIVAMKPMVLEGDLNNLKI
jgi:predicted RNA-binding protein with PUA domain